MGGGSLASLVPSALIAPAAALAFGLAVTLLFSFLLTLALHAPYTASLTSPRVIDSTFSPRDASSSDYAAQPELRIAPQRSAISRG